MTILTFEEISQIYCDRPTWDGFARAIEKAVLEKMKQQEPVATVGKGPGYWSGGHFYDNGKSFIPTAVIHRLPVGTKLYASPMPADDVVKQRDELLAALDQVSAIRNIGSAHIIAREAIANVKGGAA